MDLVGGPPRWNTTYETLNNNVHTEAEHQIMYIVWLDLNTILELVNYIPITIK